MFYVLNSMNETNDYVRFHVYPNDLQKSSHRTTNKESFIISLYIFLSAQFYQIFNEYS